MQQARPKQLIEIAQFLLKLDVSQLIGMLQGMSAASRQQEVLGCDPDRAGLADVMTGAYDELRHLAAMYLRGERPEHTLQRTALVHEAYLRLAGQSHIAWEDRGQFVAIFARIMRQTLTSHAVARSRLKRGGKDRLQVTLEFYEDRSIDVTALNEALEELETLDSRQAQIVELRFFGGLTIEEIAKVLAISPATVKREWTFAKVWLRRELY